MTERELVTELARLVEARASLGGDAYGQTISNKILDLNVKLYRTYGRSFGEYWPEDIADIIAGKKE
jgi:hypothetical protein